MKYLYYGAFAVGFSVAVYFYLINFDNMSETELVNSVLYWYLPLIFGIYGLTAHRIARKVGDEDTSALKYAFSGKDPGLISLMVLVFILSGLLGSLFLIIPLVIFKPKMPNFDIAIAITGTIVWLGALWFFFVALWPSF